MGSKWHLLKIMRLTSAFGFRNCTQNSCCKTWELHDLWWPPTQKCDHIYPKLLMKELIWHTSWLQVRLIHISNHKLNIRNHKTHFLTDRPNILVFTVETFLMLNFPMDWDSTYITGKGHLCHPKTIRNANFLLRINLTSLVHLLKFYKYKTQEFSLRFMLTHSTVESLDFVGDQFLWIPLSYEF